MIMKKNLFIAAMGLLVLAGCSNNEEIDNVVAKADNAITFEPYVGKVTKAEDNSITIPYGVFAYEGAWNANSSTPNFMFNQQVAVDGTYSPIKYWPGTDVSFIAYAPYQAKLSESYIKTSTGLPSMDFNLTVEANVDLLVSDLTTAKTGSVSLLLKHALAKVTFTTGTTGDNNTTVVINSITLKGMKQTGVLSFGETARNWTVSNPQDFTITQNVSYLLIPQALTDLTAEIKYTITTIDPALSSGNVTFTKTTAIPLTSGTITKWETSKQYNYTITPTLEKVVITAKEDLWTAAETPTIPEVNP